MSDQRDPRIRIDEIPGNRQIDGVDTTTAGFVGETERGPVTPMLVTSWQDYRGWFGEFIDHRPPNVFLPYAVRGFFDNGGRRLFIARVAGRSALTATVRFPGCDVRAIGPGAWGNNLLLSIKPASLAQDGTSTESWFRLQIAYYQTGIPQDFVDPTDVREAGNPRRVEPSVFEDHDNLSPTLMPA